MFWGVFFAFAREGIFVNFCSYREGNSRRRDEALGKKRTRADFVFDANEIREKGTEQWRKKRKRRCIFCFGRE